MGFGLPYLSAYLDSLGTNFSNGANFATSASTIRPPPSIIPQGGFSPFYLDVQYTQFRDFKPRTQLIRHQGFEHPLVACCGYGGEYNYRSIVGCGGTIEINGTKVFVGSCERPSVRVTWDGIHYTEAANKFVFDQISTGAFSDPPLPLTMACHRNSTKKF